LEKGQTSGSLAGLLPFGNLLDLGERPC
jgi:hypothetical protein